MPAILHPYRIEKTTGKNARLRSGNLQALKEAEQLLADLPTILIGLSPDLRITRWNQMAAQVFARPASEICGRPLDDVPIHWDRERVRRGIERCRKESASVRIDDLTFIRSTGQEGVLGLTINPLGRGRGGLPGFTILGADITERKILENQLAQTQKLRLIGQLASGIAHEINTPTQYVGDNLHFLKDAFADFTTLLQGCRSLLNAVRSGRASAALAQTLEDDFARADIDYLISEIPLAVQQTLEGVERISQIVRAMKEFAHPGREEKISADLNKIVETTITVARNEWKYVAEMRTDFDRSLPPVPCHAGEINQVILNLIINAAQAIEDVAKQGVRTKGVITVATRRRDDWAEIEIRDTGGGIPDEIRSRIFDPFFTTKEIGRGTGQGLAICQPVIVQKHGGSISFESAIGEGTVFRIRLPLREPAGEA